MKNLLGSESWKYFFFLPAYILYPKSGGNCLRFFAWKIIKGMSYYILGLKSPGKEIYGISKKKWKLNVRYEESYIQTSKTI